MEIKFKDGLLFTSLSITYKDTTKIINDIIIDTGASKSLIDSDIVDDLSIYYENGDKIITMYGIGGEEHAFVKILDNVCLGNINIDKHDMHFGIVDDRGEIKGLLGLDLLIKAGVTIDLKNMSMYSKEN